MLMPYRRIGLLATIVVLAWPLVAAPPAPGPTVRQDGWNPCGELKDPLALWNCWAGTGGSHEGVLATTCAAKSVCPPKDQRGKPVLNCYYEDDWKTGYRCILFCNYGATYPWGSDGGNGCN
jgi:hypothetical protein